MRKIFFSFVLACIAVAASAQMSQTPLKTFDDGYSFSVFNYKNGDQIFLRWYEDRYADENKIYFYDLSFTLKKTVNFTPATVAGFESLRNLWISDGRNLGGNANIFASEKLFNDDSFLEFIVETTNGWAIVSENYEIIFRKNYTDNWDWSGFNILETKNGNLLEVSLEKWVQTGVDCCSWYEGECYNECPIGEYIEKTEIYALPGYSLSTLRSASIQQLSDPFPNPAKTYIQLPYTLPEGVKEGTIRVFNSQGQLIKTFHVDAASEYVRLNTTSLPSGNYFYNLDTRGQKGVSKQFIVR